MYKWVLLDIPIPLFFNSLSLEIPLYTLNQESYGSQIHLLWPPNTLAVSQPTKQIVRGTPSC